MIVTFENLNIPPKYSAFLEEFVNAVRTDTRVKKVVLFGSCARGDVRVNSDIDILVTTKDELNEESELEFYDYLPDVYSNSYVPCDLIVMSDRHFEKNKYETGVVQKYINMEGVNLYESL